MQIAGDPWYIWDMEETNMDEQRFNVIEVMAPHPKAGKIAVVPVRRAPVRGRRPLQLRNARYRLSNSSFDFADGFACGIIAAQTAIAAVRSGS